MVKLLPFRACMGLPRTACAAHSTLQLLCCSDPTHPCWRLRTRLCAPRSSVCTAQPLHPLR